VVFKRTPDPRLIFPIEEPIDRRGEPQRVGGNVVHAILPTWQGGELAFRFSIQSGEEGRFSRRPGVVWAKVTPQTAAGARPYYFMDREFTPGESIPLLQLRTADWPGNAAARVELYFAADAAALPVQRRPLPADRDEVEFPVHQAMLRTAIHEVRGGGYEIVVDERHPRDVEAERSDFPLHVQVEPPPESVSRTYFDGSREAHHVFRYKVRPTSPELRVLTRREIERGPGGAAALFEGLKPGE
jgi:hypothetical protein